MSKPRRLLAARLTIAALMVLGASLGSSTLSFAAPSKQQVEAAKAKLDTLNQRLSLLVEQYDQAQIRLSEIEGQLAGAKAAADRAQAVADHALADLNDNAARAYQGFGSQISVLFDATSLADFSDRLEFLGNMAQADTDLANTAERAQQEARWLADQLRQTLAERQAIVQDLAAKRSDIQSGIGQARALYAELNKRYLDAVAAAKAAAAAAASASTGVVVGNVPGPPPAPNPNAQAAIQAAYSVIGTPYVWGSADPNVGFDCSGLTMWSWAHAGVSLPHSSAAQYGALPHVDRSNLQAGDLLFFYTPISHVGMYLTPSTMIDANHPGDVVNVRAINWDSFVGAARP
jgi:cell wall-associated NlpC family hydrolase